MSNQSKKASNQVIASVILKNAICSLDETISNCRSLIKDVIALPRGANTTKQLLCVGNQLNYIKAITQTISVEISPYINIARNTGYLHKRIKSLHSSSTSEVLKDVNLSKNNILCRIKSFKCFYPSNTFILQMLLSFKKHYPSNNFILQRIHRTKDFILRTILSFKRFCSLKDSIV